MDRQRTFDFLGRHLADSLDCVLVSVLAVEGASMRDPGAHIAVSSDGSYIGSLSGGCIENAVVAEALEALSAGAPRITRFGSGSRFLDIKLPCGGGLDIHFQPLTGLSGMTLVDQCQRALLAREPFSLRILATGDTITFVPEWQQTTFDPQRAAATIGHWPCPHLQIIGHGAAVESLTRLAGAMQLPANVLTPDPDLAKRLDKQSLPATLLSKTSDIHLLSSDPWTATIFLFHDHDWEVQLIVRALAMPHFYIGAMGGRAAHRARCEALRNAGITEQAIADLDGPVGLFHSARDPDTLALSVLAKVVSTYQQHDFQRGIG